MEVIYECILNDKESLILSEEQMDNYRAELSDGSLVIIEVIDPEAMMDEELITADIPGKGIINLPAYMWESNYPELYHSGELSDYIIS